MREPEFVALAGGTGAAKFLRGLCHVVPPEDLIVIVNTGDDWVVWGLYVSPDLDTVTYALAGLIDETKGWGVKDDTFRCLAAMASLGEETWFNLGDKDLATHLFRTEQLRKGWTLSRVTESLRQKLSVRSRIFPMSDDHVATRILTPDGWLAFQEFFVRDKGLANVLEVTYDGARDARPAPDVVEAISRARAVIVCPSNPVSSIGPILALPGIRETLATTPARVVAVSPIVGGAPLSGPAGTMMRARGLPVSPVGVALAYQGWLDVLVFDRQDAALGPEVEALRIRTVTTETLMRDRHAEIALARDVVEMLS